MQRSTAIVITARTHTILKSGYSHLATKGKKGRPYRGGREKNAFEDLQRRRHAAEEGVAAPRLGSHFAPAGYKLAQIRVGGIDI